MEPTETLPTEEIAPTLNFCDRVEILNMMMHDSEKPLSLDGMDILLGKFYPSFRHLCEDLRRDDAASKAQVTLGEDDVTFSIKFEHSTDYDGRYNEVEQNISLE